MSLVSWLNSIKHGKYEAAIGPSLLQKTNAFLLRFH